MATGPAPARPDEARSQRRTERRWLPVVGVLAVILAVTGGARGTVDALAGAPAPALHVTDAVRLHPAPGWVVERSDGDATSAAVLLARGTAVLQVRASLHAPGPPDDIADRYAREVLEATVAEPTLGEPEHAPIGGAPAVQVGYVGTTPGGVTVEGVLVALAVDGRAEVVFDAAAPAGDLAWAADDLVEMIETAELG